MPDVVLDDAVLAAAATAALGEAVLDGRAHGIQALADAQRGDAGPQRGLGVLDERHVVGSAGLRPPTTTLTAASPFQRPTWAPQSIESTSPSTSTREPGMPCTISSFTEVHSVCR